MDRVDDVIASSAYWWISTDGAGVLTLTVNRHPFAVAPNQVSVELPSDFIEGVFQKKRALRAAAGDPADHSERRKT